MPTDEEIDRFCSRLADEWKKIPDARFGALIGGLTLRNETAFPQKHCNNGEVAYRTIHDAPIEEWWDALDNVKEYDLDGRV